LKRRFPEFGKLRSLDEGRDIGTKRDLALVRTLLAPLQHQGRLKALTLSTRALGHAHGAILARQLKPEAPPALCLIRRATPA